MNWLECLFGGDIVFCVVVDGGFLNNKINNIYMYKLKIFYNIYVI